MNIRENLEHIIGRGKVNDHHAVEREVRNRAQAISQKPGASADDLINDKKARQELIKEHVIPNTVRQKIIAGVSTGVILVSGVTGAYFFPRPEGNSAIVIPASPTPSEAAGTPTPEIVGFWAKTASEAASNFGTDEYSQNPANWEPTAEGKGWHMKEDGSRHNLNFRGFAGHGYWDTLPGKNAQAVVANGGIINVQGATIWDVQGERAAQVLYNQTGKNSWSDGAIHEPLAIGFIPNPSVGLIQ